MNSDRTHDNLKRALRDLLLEASEVDLREALNESSENFDQLAARGLAAAQRALRAHDDADQVRDLHRGLGALIRLLRRDSELSTDELAKRARIDASELRCIESDPSFDPYPRTIIQLEQYFKLPARSLVSLSGAVRVEHDVQEEAIRFAASSEDMSELTRAEKRLLNRFVKYLREHTDR